MTLKDFLNFLKTFKIAEKYYIGKLDNKEEKSFGVYNLKLPDNPIQSVGGGESTYNIKGISILIHWNKNADETEQVAINVFNNLLNAKNVYIGGHTVDLIKILMPEPVSIGTDDNGIYEYVIELKIYYER